MRLRLPKCEKPNRRAMNSMSNDDVFKVREYWIVKLVQANESNDSDAKQTAVDWICSLTYEMRLRGEAKSEASNQIIVPPGAA